MTDTDSELVSILVPKLHLKEIYGFISTLDSAAGEPKKGIDWPADLVRRQFNESPEIIKRFQKLLASHPGQKFHTSEIASQLKAAKGAKSIAGALGAYGRRVANRYKMKTFPFDQAWDHAKHEQSHWMKTDVATIIKSL